MKKIIKSHKSNQEILDECLSEIWKLKKELSSYSVLFQKLDSSGLDSDALMGAGISFETMSTKLNNISDKLNIVFQKLT